jgi:sulfate transport system ATP-binding protein
MTISIRGVTKRFKKFTALDRVDLEIGDGELVALLGPSGSGKTTLLRIIAGLDTADEGSVWMDGEDTAGTKLRDRKVGFVFQHYALFRHMSIAQNIAFGLTVRPRDHRPPTTEIRRRVDELLKLIQLEWCADRYPHQLSGGQRQRIALARALAVEPKVLLLDEPFGALDAQVRGELRRWLRRLHDETGITSVFVTHDQEEAMEVADRVVVVHQGRIEQIGAPQEVYDHPATPFVCRFIGAANRFPARVAAGTASFAGIAWPSPEHGSAADSEATVFVRPHDLALHTSQVAGSFRATVKRVHAIGPTARVELAADGMESCEAHVPTDGTTGVAPGTAVWARPQRAKVFLGSV